jgi:hypothetical protein
MGDYSPLHKGDTYTRTASATITGGQLVRVSGAGTVAAVSAASDDWLGVAAFDAVNGDLVSVEVGGVQRILATGTVTQGELVHGGTAGTVVTHTNGTNDVNIVGLALTTATDAVVEIQPIR